MPAFTHTNARGAVVSSTREMATAVYSVRTGLRSARRSRLDDSSQPESSAVMLVGTPLPVISSVFRALGPALWIR